MMQLFILILKQAYQINDIIIELAKAGVKGGTILDGTGMAETLMDMEDLPLFGMLKRVLEEGKGTSKVMLVALKDDQVKTTSEIIKNVVGDLNMPNTGIMFSVPISYIEGLGK